MAIATKNLTLADLKRAAAKIGATVEHHVIGRTATVEAIAPAGKCWEDGVTRFVGEWTVYGGTPDKWERAAKSDAIAFLIAELESRHLYERGCEQCQKPITDSRIDSYCDECQHKIDSETYP